MAIRVAMPKAVSLKKLAEMPLITWMNSNDPESAPLGDGVGLREKREGLGDGR